MAKKSNFNTGQFVSTGKGVIYVDANGKKWDQQNISDLIQAMVHFKNLMSFVDHYKKYL